MPLITLMTDFGLQDWFVGVMKGVILGLNPDARIVDITHSIAPGDIRAGAFALMSARRYFPKGTIHVAVVDPGVGSKRKPILVQTTNSIFLGPDNGTLSWAIAGERVRAIRVLDNAKLFLHPLSRTFHGRDIFAPVAAHLSCGVRPDKVGRVLKEMVRLDWPEPSFSGRWLRGRIMYLDRFGNGITNIDQTALSRFGRCALAALLKGKRTCEVADYYQAVPPGQPVAVVGSSGFLEIAVNGGSAAAHLDLRTGDEISITAAA